MHISDDILPAAVWVGGFAVSAGAIGIVLSRLRDEDLPRIAVLSSFFFTASAISIPLPLGSVHLLLCGLLGIMLGWKSFPAIFTGIFFQRLILGYGGMTTLGINTFNLAAGAVSAHYLFRWLRCLPDFKAREALAGFGAGAIGTLAAACFYFASLVTSGEGFREAAYFAFGVHLPIVGVEAVMTCFAVMFLKKVQPQLLG